MPKWLCNGCFLYEVWLVILLEWIKSKVKGLSSNWEKATLTRSIDSSSRACQHHVYSRMFKRLRTCALSQSDSHVPPAQLGRLSVRYAYLDNFLRDSCVERRKKDTHALCAYKMLAHNIWLWPSYHFDLKLARHCWGSCAEQTDLQ